MHLMKRVSLILLAALFGWFPAAAEEGMWLPVLLGQLNVKHMQDLGLKLSAEDIYSINQSSLKDAVVLFGGGCTGVIVSGKGLLLTNHHCGLGSIQRLSSMAHDYITDGFWATSPGEELPCQGLTVTRMVRMEEVTRQVLDGVTATMNQFQRDQIIRMHIAELEKAAAQGTRFEARVRPFFYGNQYYLFINEVFKDIRLVGAPPASIGKFGGDTDNWMWPRHTGDFSVFRIYVAKDGSPAAWSPENVPLNPGRFLTVSLAGYREGDFTFVFGYPGSTREYLSSYGVELIVNQENPLRIALRGKRLEIMKAAMESDRLTRIQYTAKANGVANYWKKMIGESRGIRRIDATSAKRSFENQFRVWAAAGDERRLRYGAILDAFSAAYREFAPPDLANIYIQEAGQGIELVRFAASFRNLVAASRKQPVDRKEVAGLAEGMKRQATDFYKNFQAPVDRRIMVAMLGEMAQNMHGTYRPVILDEIVGSSGSSGLEGFARNLFVKSIFADSSRMFGLLDDYNPSQVKIFLRDPAYRLMTGIYEHQEKVIAPVVNRLGKQIDSLQRIYMAAQMEMQPERSFYPDANSTLRIAYGKVDDYFPADAVHYQYFTTLGGVIQKEDATISDYRVDPRLKDLFLKQDFGPYADSDGTLHVAFTASNHTTGGNSGSPVLNGYGQLIGLNFDRNWEGTLSDLKYDPDQCRNITLDIRYCLFIIDRFAGCRRLIDEMELVYR